MAKVIAVCRSKKKGTRKQAMPEGYLRPDYGLADDAHADAGSHRQLSLLAMESIDKMRGLGFDLGPGDFAENITTEGIDLVSLPIGTRIRVGDEIVLEMTQIGKECHLACAIRRQIGDCIMPKEGVFARIIQGGLVRAGDEIRIDKDGD
ncbi:MAG: MOSC domain-containing protein [Chloroflexi bacterium]|nr:MOSC domain-containing protein [Chloroflexota bacterium]